MAHWSTLSMLHLLFIAYQLCSECFLPKLICQSWFIMAGTQAMALSLLGNCATQPDVLKAVSTSCDAGGQPAMVTVTKLLSSQDATLFTKAATLVGNLCHNSKLRSQV
jgi:hypothetical protein